METSWEVGALGGEASAVCEPLQPAGVDTAAILVAIMVQGMAIAVQGLAQGAAIAALKDELKAEFKGHLTSLAKHMAEKVT